MTANPPASTARLPDLPVTGATRVSRKPQRQITDRAQLYALLDEALLAHVGVVRDGHPIVLPMACARDGDALLLHGSTGGGMLREAAGGVPVAATVTLLDGLVLARTSTDHSMNYRSAMMRGVAEVLVAEAAVEALAVITNHLVPGRWEEVRPSTTRELAATLVLRLPLTEVSLKVRAAGPNESVDDGEDRAVWAGVLPLGIRAGDPAPSELTPSDVPVPASVHRAVHRAGGG